MYLYNIVINTVYNKSWSSNCFLNKTLGGVRLMVQLEEELAQLFSAQP